MNPERKKVYAWSPVTIGLPGRTEYGEKQIWLKRVWKCTEVRCGKPLVWYEEILDISKLK